MIIAGTEAVPDHIIRFFFTIPGFSAWPIKIITAMIENIKLSRKVNEIRLLSG
jgi:hypothetical protein